MQFCSQSTVRNAQRFFVFSVHLWGKWMAPLFTSYANLLPLKHSAVLETHFHIPFCLTRTFSQCTSHAALSSRFYYLLSLFPGLAFMNHVRLISVFSRTSFRECFIAEMQLLRSSCKNFAVGKEGNSGKNWHFTSLSYRRIKFSGHLCTRRHR